MDITRSSSAQGCGRRSGRYATCPVEPGSFLDLERARNYEELERQSRLRGLLEETIDAECGGCCDAPASVTIHWQGIRGCRTISLPEARVFACICTARSGISLVYEAERRMMRANDSRAELKRDDWAKQRGCCGLEYQKVVYGLPLFLLVYRVSRCAAL